VPLEIIEKQGFSERAKSGMNPQGAFAHLH